MTNNKKLEDLAEEYANKHPDYFEYEKKLTAADFKAGYLAAKKESEGLVEALKEECCCESDSGVSVVCGPCEALKKYESGE